MASKHRWILFLTSEPAAGLRLHHTNFFFGHAEQTNEGFVDVIRALQRTPHGHALRWIGLCDHSLRLDVQLLLRPGLILALNDKISRGPRRIHISLLHVVGLE